MTESDEELAANFREGPMRVLGLYEPTDDEIVLRGAVGCVRAGEQTLGPQQGEADGMTLREAKKRWPAVLLWGMTKTGEEFGWDYAMRNLRAKQ